MPQNKGGKKARKIGRNKKWCEAYRSREQREVNKARGVLRHLIHHPGDNRAFHAYTNLPLRARETHPLPDDFTRHAADRNL